MKAINLVTFFNNEMRKKMVEREIRMVWNDIKQRQKWKFFKKIKFWYPKTIQIGTYPLNPIGSKHLYIRK